jgi:hypothetical protein
MKVPNSLSYVSLVNELTPVVDGNNPSLISVKVSQITERLLTELTYEKIVQLDKIVQSSKPQMGNMQSMFADSIVKEMVSQVKKTKPELEKLEKVQQFFQDDQLDEAVSVLNTMDSTFEEQVSEVRLAIAQQYLFKGNKVKYDSLMQGSKRSPIHETPAESVKVQVGQELVHSGMDNLRTAIPSNSLPSDAQMDKAMKGLHEMSAYSVGKKRDDSLDDKSIEELKEKLVQAEKKLEQERINYDTALSTTNPNIYMPALERKQQVMKEVLSLTQALHQKGVPQAEEKNPQEVLNKAILDGFTEMREVIRNRTGGSEKDECIIS